MMDDTELLLVLVRSSLDARLADSLSEAVILTALADADGSVELAADALRRGGSGEGSGSLSTTAAASPSSTVSRKRRRDPTVADWLVQSPAKRQEDGRQALLTYGQRRSPLKRPPVAPAPPKPPPSLPPLLLATPQLLAQHLPCVAVPKSPLTADLASALYLELMEESAAWKQMSYNIGGRQVVSPHTTAFYQNAVESPYPPNEVDESARFWNNNILSPSPQPYSKLLQQAAQLVEEVVNAELAARPNARKPAGEWRGRWKASVAGVNRYEGSASGVGPHADQLTYLGPYPTIASLSLGTSRKFRLRQVPSKDPSEKWKHSIPPQPSIDAFRPAYDLEQTLILPDQRSSYSSRIAITFRFYRPDFAPGAGEGAKGRKRQGTPRCPCGLPCMLKADQRNTVALSLRPPSAPSPSVEGDALRSPTSDPLASPALRLAPGGSEDPFLFYWTCTKRAGWAGPSNDDGSKKPAGMRDGCSFFRVLDLEREGRDCGVPLPDIVTSAGAAAKGD